MASYNIPIVNQPMYHSCCDTLCSRKHWKKAIRLNWTGIIFTKHSSSSVNNNLSIFVGTNLRDCAELIKKKMNLNFIYLMGHLVANTVAVVHDGILVFMTAKILFNNTIQEYSGTPNPLIQSIDTRQYQAFVYQRLTKATFTWIPSILSLFASSIKSCLNLASTSE